MIHQQARTDSYPIQEGSVSYQQGVDHGFICKEDELFWDSLIAHDSIGEEVEENKLREEYYQQFPATPKRIWKSIKRFLGLEFDETIATRTNFINLTKYFGSVKPYAQTCFLAEQVKSLVDESRMEIIENGTKKKITWFVGFMEFQEVKRRMTSCKAGTFLVRFSSQQPGEFIMNVKSVENEVIQRTIKGNYSTACNDPYDYDGEFHIDSNQETEPTLTEFVREKVFMRRFGGVKCEHIYPDSPLNSVFKGYK